MQKPRAPGATVRGVGKIRRSGDGGIKVICRVRAIDYGKDAQPRLHSAHASHFLSQLASHAAQKASDVEKQNCDDDPE